jgi:hypothetical protein
LSREYACEKELIKVAASLDVTETKTEISYESESPFPRREIVSNINTILDFHAGGDFYCSLLGYNAVQ